MKTRKLICALVIVALIAAPCASFASTVTVNWDMKTGQMSGARILSWTQIVSQLNEMAGLCDDVTVGTVAEYFNDPAMESDAGFPLYFGKFGNGEKVLWIMAQIHGNEKLTSVGLMEFLWEYATSAALRDELKDLTIYAVPMYNVDGGAESTAISYKGIAGQNGVRTVRVYNENGTVLNSSLDMNRDWKLNQRGEGMGFVSKTTRAYYRLWADVKPDFGFDMHHQGSYVTNNNPITFSFGIALLPSGPYTIADARPPVTSTNNNYAVTLPFIKDYDNVTKQMQRYIYDQIKDDVKNLFVYTSSSPNSTSQAAANGAAIGDVYVNPCIDLYPGVDLYGVVVAAMMMGLNYNNWNPYRWSCPAWLWRWSSIAIRCSSADAQGT